MSQKPNIALFGGEPLGVPALNKLKEAGIIPDLVVCSPDRPAGRGMKLVSPAVKIWAEENNIKTYQPTSLKDDSVKEALSSTEWDLFIVVAYNHILPSWLLNTPKKGCLNLHPSLLPALRGPSPIRTAILQNEPENIGVTVMLLDEKMDTGGIIEQEVHIPKTWPMSGPELDAILADMGGELLAEVVPVWLNDEVSPQEQNHDEATYTNKFLKGENELSINPFNLPSDEEAFNTLCKIYAWQGIGDTFFIHTGKRIKVKAADLTADGSLNIISVVPEGKKEMSFDSFLQSLT